MRSTERILTTHTGSLPKPDDLVRLIWEKAEGGAVDEPELEARVAESVKALVAQQREVGIDIVSDGEVSKSGFSSYVHERFSGFGKPVEVLTRALDLEDYPELAVALVENEAVQHVTFRQCEGPIELKDPEAVERDIANLAEAIGDTPREMAFLNAPSPGQITFNHPNRYFDTHQEYLHGVADALRYEYRAITDAGFNLQIDSPDLAMVGHYQFGDGVGEHMAHVDAAIEALNHALNGLPAERIRLHLCWGNYVGAHNHDVPLSAIIRQVLKANVGTISFEAANPTHEYEWEVFKDIKLPEDKVIMPGVIDVQTPRLEHPRVVAQRLLRFTDLVGREQVIAGTDCGFSTFAGWHNIPVGVVWGKLRALSEGAEIASRELW
jgi:5-methyltetrahydropteroyltriglutamate--homocysteine methyltransferase